MLYILHEKHADRVVVPIWRGPRRATTATIIVLIIAKKMDFRQIICYCDNHGRNTALLKLVRATLRRDAAAVALLPETMRECGVEDAVIERIAPRCEEIAADLREIRG